jgi:hypothetical protein
MLRSNVGGYAVAPTRLPGKNGFSYALSLNWDPPLDRLPSMNGTLAAVHQRCLLSPLQRLIAIGLDPVEVAYSDRDCFLWQGRRRRRGIGGLSSPGRGPDDPTEGDQAGRGVIRCWRSPEYVAALAPFSTRNNTRKAADCSAWMYGACRFRRALAAPRRHLSSECPANFGNFRYLCGWDADPRP